jgi:two-component system CheB/CheR fusion protein
MPKKKIPHEVDAEPSIVRVRGRRPEGDARFLKQQDLNEELQSRNEELETVNEELQSLNDEMSTMEEQMRGLAEEARRANDFLRLLLDTSTDVLMACDEGNRVTFWNKAAIKRFRLSPAQAVGGELFDLVPALATPALRDAVRKARGTGRATRITVREKGTEYQLDPLPVTSGKRRGYLLRLRTGK